MGKIYIRKIEGVESFVPVDAEKLDENIYKITNNEDIDLENDAITAWEFFPGDVVKCEEPRGYLLATTLVSMSDSFPNRKIHQLIFNIVLNFGDISGLEFPDFKEVSNLLCKIDLYQKNHPIVKKWIEGHCS